MIEVDFSYRTKDKKWHDDSRSFDDVIKAFRFIMKCKKTSGLFFRAYYCIDPEDNEYLSSRV